MDQLLSPNDLSTRVLADPLCQQVVRLAEERRLDVAVVGGWVRDALLGREPLDWDFVVAGDPTPLVRALHAAGGRGAIATLDPNWGIYRTTTRTGVTLDFAAALGGAIETDLRRRDLTINAIAMRLTDGAFLDPLQGYDDLRERRVRAGSRQNLVDDPLRLVRVYRFAATLGWGIDPETEQWCGELAANLAPIPGERVLAELTKLLTSGRGAATLAAMHARGLLGATLGADLQVEAPEAGCPLYPAVATIEDLLKKPPTPAVSRLAAWLAEAPVGDRPRTAALLLAALLGAPDHVAPAVERLRLSRLEATLLRDWTAPIPTLPESLRLAAHRAWRDMPETAPALPLLAHVQGQPLEQADAWLAAIWAYLDIPPARLFDGTALCRELGRTPGPWLGALLKALGEAQALGAFDTSAGAIAWAKGHVEQQANETP